MAPVPARSARRALLAAACAVALSACEPNRFVTGWVPYWGGSAGRAVIDNDDAASLIGEVSMMWYTTDDDGTIDLMASQSSLNTTVASARAQGLPVIPTIFDGQPKGVMRGILANSFNRAAHVQRIVDLVMAQGFDGIDIDYEVFAFGDGSSAWASIRPTWIAFVQELAALLHQRGKLLSVTVPPVWRDSNGTTRGYTVYAPEVIGEYVDRLRLMVYDWSITSPGPIAPDFWVNQVIDWNDSRVPNSRLQLGVPAYGRHWSTKKFTNETCPDGAVTRRSITMKQMAPLAAAHGLTPVRHSSGEVTFGWTEVVTGPVGTLPTPPTYVPPSTTVPAVPGPADPDALEPAMRVTPPGSIVTCTIQHTVFIPDATTVRTRAEAALDAGWSGIAIWAFGYESADVYSELAAVTPARPGGDPSGVLDTPTATVGTVRATGYAVHPEFDLPVAVSITVIPTTGDAAVAWRVVTARTERASMADGLGPFHGFDETFTVAPGSYQVCATVLLWGGEVGPNLGCQTAAVPAA